MRIITLVMPVLILALFACGDDTSEDGPTEPGLSFFVTSIGTGESGGDIGGLEGADAMCQALADAVGAGDRAWRAYLSTSTENARDRIGTGPWYNARLQEIAADVEALHGDEIPRLLWGVTDDPDQEGLVIDENGALVPLVEHDIVTGSTKEGTVSEGRTCLDWTSASEDEVAQVGHSDLAPPEITIGGPDRLSWNSAHETVSCSKEGLAARQGAGRFYCFAAD